MNKPLWNSKTFKFHIYDQKLQLVDSGRVKPEQKQRLLQNLEQCSLLFNINNTGYFLKNS